MPSTKITEKVGLDPPIPYYEEHRLTKCEAQYAATQINSKINEVQKQIGAKKKAKQNADDLMKEKIELEKEKKVFIDSAAEKNVVLKKKIATIGNIVHDSVPVNNNEVWLCETFSSGQYLTSV